MNLRLSQSINPSIHQSINQSINHRKGIVIVISVKSGSDSDTHRSKVKFGHVKVDAWSDDGAVEDEAADSGRSVDRQRNFLVKFAQNFSVKMDFYSLVTACDERK